eukprot:s975_g40.t1
MCQLRCHQALGRGLCIGGCCHMGGADALLLTSLGGALAILAKYLKGNSAAMTDGPTPMHLVMVIPSKLNLLNLLKATFLTGLTKILLDFKAILKMNMVMNKQLINQLMRTLMRTLLFNLDLRLVMPSKSFLWPVRLCQIQKKSARA